ncbi:unnamed protein product, partial [Prorocentrum cordatum]
MIGPSASARIGTPSGSTKRGGTLRGGPRLHEDRFQHLYDGDRHLQQDGQQTHLNECIGTRTSTRRRASSATDRQEIGNSRNWPRRRRRRRRRQRRVPVAMAGGADTADLVKHVLQQSDDHPLAYTPI